MGGVDAAPAIGCIVGAKKRSEALESHHAENVRMTEPVCLEPDYTPCRFNAVCHAGRRKIQSEAGLRGANCWAYDSLIVKIAQRMQELDAPHEEPTKQ
jgi:hypothetical protein